MKKFYLIPAWVLAYIAIFFISRLVYEYIDPWMGLAIIGAAIYTLIILIYKKIKSNEQHS